MKTIAIIPARAGSKGVPGKNIALVAGKPLIGWSIDAARAALSVDRIIVSTDGEEIAKVARSCGAEVPFMRPAELAQDDTPAIPPVLHALDWLKAHEGYEPDYVLLLQPTSPLRISSDIEAAIRLAKEKKADSVIGLTRSARHPYWAKKLEGDGVISPFIETKLATSRRQELPPAYDVTGAIYLVKTNVLRERNSFYTEASYAYLMPPERALDIDAPWDLQLAELILRARG